MSSILGSIECDGAEPLQNRFELANYPHIELQEGIFNHTYSDPSLGRRDRTSVFLRLQMNERSVDRGYKIRIIHHESACFLSLSAPSAFWQIFSPNRKKWIQSSFTPIHRSYSLGRYFSLFANNLNVGNFKI
jgi:hypothetical protein